MSGPIQSPDRNRVCQGRRDLAIAGFLFLALFAFYIATSPGHEPYGDESCYLNVGRNILVLGSPMRGEIQQDQNGHAYLAGGRYAQYPLGQSLLEIPVLLLIQILKPRPVFLRLILNLLPALECALLAGLLYLATRLPGIRRGEPLLPRRVAAILALAAGLTTQLWPSASTHFADTSAAALTFAAFYLALRFQRAGAGGWTLILAAWAMALAFFCKNTYLLAWPALGIYGLWAVRRRCADRGRLGWTALLCALPLALAIGGQLWFNHLRYGTIWQGGYHDLNNRDGIFGFNTPLLVGLHGILFSSGSSLFLYSPLCVMAFFGWRRLARRMPAEIWLAAGIALPLILTYARWWSWSGGWEWGSRFFLFLVPLLMWISAPAWLWLDRPPRRPSDWVRVAMLTLLLGVSLLVQLLGVLIHPLATWELNAFDMKVLEKSVYEKGVWEIRDDNVLNHFVPEFSPVAFNAWLVWATWNREKLSETEIARQAPPAKLNPRWVPRDIGPYLTYNVWFWKEWTRPDGSKPLVIGILLVLGIVVALGLTGTIRWTARPCPSAPGPGPVPDDPDGPKTS